MENFIKPYKGKKLYYYNEFTAYQPPSDMELSPAEYRKKILKQREDELENIASACATNQLQNNDVEVVSQVTIAY